MQLIVFDLDDTLVDTGEIRTLRGARRWKECVKSLSKTRIFDGISELFCQAKQRDLKIAIVTTSVSYYALAVTQFHKIRYDLLIAYHDAPPKPRPDGINLVLSSLRIKPAEALGIGDADTDATAYKAAGVTSIGAGWSPLLSRTSPWDRIIARPTDVFGL